MFWDWWAGGGGAGLGWAGLARGLGWGAGWVWGRAGQGRAKQGMQEGRAGQRRDKVRSAVAKPGTWDLDLTGTWDLDRDWPGPGLGPGTWDLGT